MGLGSGTWNPRYGIQKKPIPDPGSRDQKAPDPGSRIRIRNTAKNVAKITDGRPWAAGGAWTLLAGLVGGAASCPPIRSAGSCLTHFTS